MRVSPHTAQVFDKALISQHPALGRFRDWKIHFHSLFFSILEVLAVLGVEWIFICLELLMPEHFDIARVDKIDKIPVLFFCKESPVLPIEFGKVFILSPSITFMWMTARSPLPQPFLQPMTEGTESVRTVDKSVVVTPSSDYGIQCFN